MGILAKLKGIVGGTKEETTEAYECRDCGAEYDLPVNLCEACGGDRVARAR